MVGSCVGWLGIGIGLLKSAHKKEVWGLWVNHKREREREVWLLQNGCQVQD